ncbi:hypothetical protein [Palleronia caenipelagi]|uniref:Uncharacterized protein n=1 Tax=Palleronia caenipelagi TaxID=2489174 RepID=A0A547PNT3_9RHOB|nr:hypothetical protein [Palleronia caenipelagi]TRD15780.1 hypothetical protein FEV53_15070 [Palleronia caenipelagi]
MNPFVTSALVLTLPLAACVPAPQQSLQLPAGLSPAMSVSAAPTATDLALSCPQISAELSRVYAEQKVVDGQVRRQSVANDMTSGVLDAGLTMAGARGGLSGLRAAGAASTAAGAITASGGTAAQSRQIALAQRTIQLERARVQKGC